MIRMDEIKKEWDDEARAALLISQAKNLQHTIERQRETLRRVVREARRQNKMKWQAVAETGPAILRFTKACAAGPWHDASEEPPQKGRYWVWILLDVDSPWCTPGPGSALYDRQIDENGDPCGHLRWWLPGANPVLYAWAEIRIPDHIPDAGKMIEPEVTSK